MNSEKNVKIAVVGDVHDLWNEYDHLALEFLEVDLVLFVGDFGNESLSIVEDIAAIKIPKATIMGNHDAWYTATPWGQHNAPYDRNLEDRVQIQLDLLAPSHVGYGYLDFPELELSVVGSRPFSWGGSEWKCTEFYQQRFGVSNFEESTAKMMTAVEQTKYDDLILMGHNGPFGLGANPEDTCGKDWKPLGGDFGDPDFQKAIELSQQQGKQISLVTFGHMHHSLRHTQTRRRTIINHDRYSETIYLNAAATPRIKRHDDNHIHQFCLVNYTAGKIDRITLTSVTEKMTINSEEILWTTNTRELLAIDSKTK